MIPGGGGGGRHLERDLWWQRGGEHPVGFRGKICESNGNPIRGEVNETQKLVYQGGGSATEV